MNEKAYKYMLLGNDYEANTIINLMTKKQAVSFILYLVDKGYSMPDALNEVKTRLN